MMINPRSGWEGDFYCDEGSHEIQGKIIPVPWEKNMCICSGTSWGWIPEDPPRDLDWLIRMVADVITRDGNILINFGPDGQGEIPQEAQARARELGKWLKENAEAVYGTRGGPLEPVDKVYGTTYNGDHIYLHIQDRNAFAGSVLPLTGYRVLTAECSGTPVEFTQNDEGVIITLPQSLPEAADTIVKIRVDHPMEEQTDAKIYFTGK